MLRSGQLEPQRKGKRILVVDDEPRMIGFIRMNLELENHQVLEARNGLEALDAMRTQLPDLVLLDVMMPELDGFETLRMLREFSDIPVIMLTAKGEEKRQSNGAGAGRGRLHHQALWHTRADQPHQSHLPPLGEADHRTSHPAD